MTAQDDVKEVFLQPGELFVADADFQIRTILGSCVSITLWHPEALVGGMSHFLLPTRGKVVPTHRLEGCYADEALAMMFKDLKAAGVNHKQCQAKVFGGGNMFPGHTQAGDMNVGQRNGEAARLLLQQHGIELVTESLYGNGHRQVIFSISSGEVWSRQLRPTAAEGFADYCAIKGSKR
jgi:chemotaxis protein CheD